MISIFNKFNQHNTSNQFIIIVSGLPRSGTSLMMQMLQAGGIPVVIDSIRKADMDNPRGYYEFEKAKQINKNSKWLPDCYGKALKMVSQLLYKLPPYHKYKIIFMQRHMKEILASQKRMLERQGSFDHIHNDHLIAAIFEKHLAEIINWLKSQLHIDVLYVSYNDIIKYPFKSAKIVNNFLKKSLNEEKMVNVIDPTLHRNRQNPKT